LYRYASGIDPDDIPRATTLPKVFGKFDWVLYKKASLPVDFFKYNLVGLCRLNQVDP
jgi:hypothetical protein